LFSGVTGKVVKRADTTGLLKATAGVLSGASAGTDYEAPVVAGTVSQYYRGDKTWQTLDKSAVDLGNVTNDAQIKSTDFPSSSVDGEISLFSGVTGKIIKRADTTGLLKATAGVLSAASAGTDYEAPIAAGATSQFWRGDKTWQNVPVALLTGYILNLKVSRNVSFPDSQLDISTGRTRADDGTMDLILASPLTINLATSGVNGLDTGVEAANTWYYIWLIYNPGTTTYAGLFSLSSTSPTLPAGYTKKRRLLSVRNNASSNFWGWTQITSTNTRQVLYEQESSTNLLVLNAGTSTSFVTVACSSLIPPTSQTGIFGIWFNSTVGTRYAKIRPNGVTKDPPMVAQYPGSSQIPVGTDSSQNIQYANSSSGGASTIWVQGFIEEV
jgi:hypothetical protein